jgi:hypothetical protein
LNARHSFARHIRRRVQLVSWLVLWPPPALPTRARPSPAALKVRAADASFDPRTFRRELSRSGNYNRKFLKDEDSAKKMEDDGIGYSKSEYPHLDPHACLHARLRPRSIVETNSFRPTVEAPATEI